MAKAFLISPADKSVELINLKDRNDIVSLVGYDTIASDGVDSNGDRLYFDEECFIRGASGRFQIDKLIPVAGKGIVVGAKADDADLTDVSISRDDLLSRIRFE